MRNLSTVGTVDSGEAGHASRCASGTRDFVVGERQDWEGGDERRAEAATHSQTAVLHELAQVRMAHDYDWAELQAVVNQLAKAGRDAELTPEQVLAIVRQLGDQAAMGDVSEWWRSILMDRIERWCVAAYYCLDEP